MENPELNHMVDLMFGLANHLHHEIKERSGIKLNPTQKHTLMFIRCRRNPLMREIATYLSIRPPSATTLIEELKRLGYVRRVTDADDKRAIRVSLTPVGQELLRKQFKLIIKGIGEMMRPLTETEKKQFVTILDKILTNVEPKHV